MVFFTADTHFDHANIIDELVENNAKFKALRSPQTEGESENGTI